MVADVFFGEVELLKEVCHDFWMVFGDIGCFSDVGLEIVEGELFDVGAVGWGDVSLPNFAFFGFIECGVWKVEFPIAFSDRSEGLVLVEEEGTLKFLLGAVEDFGNIEAVDDAVDGGFCSCEFCDGGHEVDGGSDEVVSRSGGNFTRSANDKGNTQATLVGACFGAAERFAISSVRSFSPPRAVVAGEDDVGVIIEAKFFDFIEEAAGVEVEFFDDGSVESCL